jgi:LemA protein
MVGLLEVVAGFAALLVVYSAGRWLAAAHNSLVEARENTERAWSNVEVLLQRRHDEMRDLVDIAREHVDREDAVLSSLLTARERAIEARSPPEAARADVELRTAIDDLYSVAEEYPELRADEEFETLRETVSELEQRIEDRREYYNDAVARYNSRLRRLPERLFAGYYGYGRREPFRADPEAVEGLDIRERFDREVGSRAGATDPADDD